MMLAPPNPKLRQNSVQELPDAQKPGGTLEFYGYTQRGPLLPAYGTRNRQRVLQQIFRHDYNWMVQGAFAGIGNLISTTPWEMAGPEDVSADEQKYYRAAYKAAQLTGNPKDQNSDVQYFQEVLRQADFGRGWTQFIKKLTLDYLRYDHGAYFEIIAPGSPLKEPTGPVMGIAHLDSLHCIPTGDPDYPVLYYDRKNRYHLMHRTRVVNLIDMPDGDDYNPGYGLSALSRAVSISMREILMGRYIESSLDDKPPPGMVIAKGMTRQEREKAYAAYRTEQSSDQKPEWGKQLWFYAADAALDVDLIVKNFSQPPEKFDYEKYTLIDVDALALAIGVDRQDLWQLSGGNIGSGTQSQVLAQKSRGKTIGNFRTALERGINDILPEDYEFAFKYRDTQEDQEQAQIAQAWAGFSASMRGTLSTQEQRVLLANQVEAVKDAITDENGQVRVHDADVQPQNAVVDDATEGTGADSAPPDSNPSADAPATAERRLGVDMGGQPDAHRAKEIQSTLTDFENAFADTIKARQTGDMNGLRFGVIARGLLRTYGLKAFRDGLEAGGVPVVDDEGMPVPLDADEQAAFNSWLVEQSAYVTEFGKSLTGGSEASPESKAATWANKSLMPIYQEGVFSADSNGNYQWVYGDTEHCKDCRRLNGQVHRIKDYRRKGWLPQSDQLSCHGYNCKCQLVKTTERAKGRF